MSNDNQPLRTWAESQAIRDDLFERASIGEITGDQADAEAIRLGLGSLSRRPGPGEFRPEAETNWTLPMAVAWIAYRDVDVVREWSVFYRAEHHYWIWQRWRRGFDGPTYEGWHLQQQSTPTLSLLGIATLFDSETGGRPLAMSFSEAESALWIALREGVFLASGIDTETGRRVQIPTLEWHELVAVEGAGKVDEVRRGMMSTGYRDVLVPSVALLGFWRRPTKSVDRLPSSVRPDGNGYMPLYCAAQWIATEGGVRDFPPNDPVRWRSAYAVLLAAIASQKVRVVGMHGGQREIVAGHVFAGIQVVYPFEEAALAIEASSELYLRSYPYLDEEHWRGGFDDTLVQARADKWTQIVVDQLAIRQLWPFTEETVAEKTGLAGRPSKSRHFIEDELQRRAAGGTLSPTLAAQSQALLDWLIETHKGAQRPTVRVIANNIRQQYRDLKKDTK